jgi:hypothetical protein
MMCRNEAVAGLRQRRLSTVSQLMHTAKDVVDDTRPASNAPKGVIVEQRITWGGRPQCMLTPSALTAKNDSKFTAWIVLATRYHPGIAAQAGLGLH